MTPRTHERFMVPARISKAGFSSEKVYRIRLATGEDFRAMGFTSYIFDQSGVRFKDIDWDGEIDGFCEVIFISTTDRPYAIIIEPPQVHGVDHTGYIEIAKNDLQLIKRDQWNSHDKYGT